LNTHFEYKNDEIEIVPTASGFYCKWPGGETYTMMTPETALFLAERMIEMPEIYGPPKAANLVS
jgi:hypothetical protein